jgi:hypothetical protein
MLVVTGDEILGLLRASNTESKACDLDISSCQGFVFPEQVCTFSTCFDCPLLLGDLSGMTFLRLWSICCLLLHLCARAFPVTLHVNACVKLLLSVGAKYANPRSAVLVAVLRYLIQSLHRRTTVCVFWRCESMTSKL